MFIGALFVAHYIHRSLIYPLMTRTGKKTMPLLIVLFAIGALLFSDTQSYVATAEKSQSAREQAHKLFEKISDVLRRTGRNASAGQSYPTTLGDNTQLHYNRRVDLDGNGYFFDDSSAAVEWGSTIYTIRRTVPTDNREDNVVYIFDQESQPLALLGRYCTVLEFSSQEENHQLGWGEVKVTIRTTYVDAHGVSQDYEFAGTVFMRNR